MICKQSCNLPKTFFEAEEDMIAAIENWRKSANREPPVSGSSVDIFPPNSLSLFRNKKTKNSNFYHFSQNNKIIKCTTEIKKCKWKKSKKTFFGEKKSEKAWGEEDDVEISKKTEAEFTPNKFPLKKGSREEVDGESVNGWKFIIKMFGEKV